MVRPTHFSTYAIILNIRFTPAPSTEKHPAGGRACRAACEMSCYRWPVLPCLLDLEVSVFCLALARDAVSSYALGRPGEENNYHDPKVTLGATFHTLKSTIHQGAGATCTAVRTLYFLRWGARLYRRSALARRVVPANKH